MKYISFFFLLLFSCVATAQQKKVKLEISGTAGVTYDGYGLSSNPATPNFYNPRRPWNLVRFSFQPNISFGDFKLPFNFNFSPIRRVGLADLLGGAVLYV